jgi:alanine dehydrogenase
MIVGILKEIKDNENRVGLTPEGARNLVAAGHSVLVEHDAGAGSGFGDTDYELAGAGIAADAASICAAADLIVKIKEPLPREYGLFKPGQIIFTFFHFASGRRLTQAMIDAGAVCVGYETVQTAEGYLPLLAPMSEIAGKMAPLMAFSCLAKTAGGKGMLACPVARVPAARVVILGGGTAGQAAAAIATGIGAEIVLIEKDHARIDCLKKLFPAAACAPSMPETIEKYVAAADVLIGCVHVPGAQAPRLVSRDMVKKMEPGSVIVDIAIDQGGCIETSRPTTHARPTYIEEGVVHYCVANMPGIFPRTATLAITGATLPYVLQLAAEGLGAFRNAALLRGLNICKGKITNRAVAEGFGLPWADARDLIGEI